MQQVIAPLQRGCIFPASHDSGNVDLSKFEAETVRICCAELAGRARIRKRPTSTVRNLCVRAIENGSPRRDWGR